jgi:hypothetical protein
MNAASRPKYKKDQLLSKMTLGLHVHMIKTKGRNFNIKKSKLMGKRNN